MTYREVKYLADSIEMQTLMSKYSLTLKIINNEKIFLISRCFVYEIHGLVVEDFFYFDLYPIELSFCSSLDRLLSDFDSKKIQSIYQSQTTRRKKIAISKLQGNEENTLKAEQYFFTMIQIMDELLEDLMFCKKKIRKQHCSEIFDYKKKELMSVLKVV